jgi:thiosulfate/3-mercaptopyruvate sulfurtransferase
MTNRLTLPTPLVSTDWLAEGRKVTYCGVGVAATSDALALTLLGEFDIALYDGSLHEWASNPELPLEVG